MAHVVTDACVMCKYTDCVDVCPVDCFHEGPNTLVIDPNECIDCAVCVPQCPANAIFADDDVTQDQLPFIELNAQLSKKWPLILHSKSPMPDADQWREVKNKIIHLVKE